MSARQADPPLHVLMVGGEAPFAARVVTLMAACASLSPSSRPAMQASSDAMHGKAFGAGFSSPLAAPTPADALGERRTRRRHVPPPVLRRCPRR